MDPIRKSLPPRVSQANPIATQKIPRLAHLHPLLRGNVCWYHYIDQEKQVSSFQNAYFNIPLTLLTAMRTSYVRINFFVVLFIK
jgi:hypothetical protein